VWVLVVFSVWVFYGACDYVRRLWCFGLGLCLWVFRVCFGLFLSLMAWTNSAMADGKRERERAVEMREK
jgi:hypothetical protein